MIKFIKQISFQVFIYEDLWGRHTLIKQLANSETYKVIKIYRPKSTRRYEDSNGKQSYGMHCKTSAQQNCNKYYFGRYSDNNTSNTTDPNHHLIQAKQ